jgi:hypothetical protein
MKLEIALASSRGEEGEKERVLPQYLFQGFGSEAT